jgi:hypothetical protein
MKVSCVGGLAGMDVLGDADEGVVEVGDGDISASVVVSEEGWGFEVSLVGEGSSDGADGDKLLEIRAVVVVVFVVVSRVISSVKEATVVVIP